MLLNELPPMVAREYSLAAIEHVHRIYRVIHSDHDLEPLLEVGHLLTLDAAETNTIAEARSRIADENLHAWQEAGQSGGHFAAALVTSSLEWALHPNPWAAAHATSLYSREAAAYVETPERNRNAWHQESSWQAILQILLAHPEKTDRSIRDLLRLAPPGPTTNTTVPADITDPALTINAMDARRYAADVAYHVHPAWNLHHRNDPRIYTAIETARDETSNPENLKTACKAATEAAQEALDQLDGPDADPRSVYAAQAAAGACLPTVEAAVVASRHHANWCAYHADLSGGGDGTTGYTLEKQYQNQRADRYVDRAIETYGDDWDPATMRHLPEPRPAATLHA